MKIPTRENSSSLHSIFLKFPEAMGVATGGGGTWGTRPSVQNSGEHPHKIMIFKEIFLNIYQNFGFSNISKIKWAKSEEKSQVVGRWF